MSLATVTTPITYPARGMSTEVGVPVIPGTNTPMMGTLLTNDAYKSISFRGQSFGGNASGVTPDPYASDLAEYVTSAEVDMSWDAITQVSMQIEDPGLQFYKTNMFDLGTEVAFNGIPYIINDVAVTGGSSTLGGVTVKCRPKSVQLLKNRIGRFNLPNASSTDFALSECKTVNVSFYGQATLLQPNIARDVPQPSDMSGEIPSTWTTLERLAQQEGFVLFESNGAIFFAQPTWLFDTFSINNGSIGVYWESKRSAFENQQDLALEEAIGLRDTRSIVNMSNFPSPGTMVVDRLALENNKVERWDEAINVPEVEVAYDQGPIPKYTVNFEVALETAWSYYIGRRVILRGVGWVMETQPLIVTAVSFDLAGTGNCQVTAQTPINPSSNNKPVLKTSQFSNQGEFGQYANVISPGKYGKNTYNQSQINNAVQIYDATLDYAAKHPSAHITIADAVIAIMTAITETSLVNYANPDVPTSLQYSSSIPRDGAPFSDHSIGLFQQRDSWGSVAQRMDPQQATMLFLERESQVRNRTTKLPGAVCQVVQVSAYPDRYQQNYSDAMALVQGMSAPISGPSGPGSTTTGWRPGHPLGTRRASDFVNIALKMVGKPYVYGASNGNMYNVPSAFDCSSLIEWCAFQVGVQYPRDTYSQWPWCENHGTTISVSEAAQTRGAVLFRDPLANDAHTAISLGNGNTVQAYDTGIGVIANQARTSVVNQNFNYAALIPNMDYS